MEELTQDHLNQGIERLARVLYDEFYVISSDKNRLVLIHDIKKQQITERRIITGQDICLFASAVYNCLLDVEKDQCIVSALDRLVFGINGRVRQGRDIPSGFNSAYRFIQQLNSQSITFTPEQLRSMSGSELDNAVSQLEEFKNGLQTGESVFIASVDTLAKLARQRGLADVFMYKGNFYCTGSPQTYQFRKDLQTAMEMLR